MMEIATIGNRPMMSRNRIVTVIRKKSSLRRGRRPQHEDREHDIPRIIIARVQLQRFCEVVRCDPRYCFRLCVLFRARFYTDYNQIIDSIRSFSFVLANGIEQDANPHTRSFLRESSLILLLLLGLVFTIILLVMVGFYCRDSWKRGRIFKSRSTDADYLINGLYL